MCTETFLSFEDNIDLGNNDIKPKVVFKNNTLNMSVLLTANFEIDEVSSEREVATEGDINTDHSDFITVYECVETDLYKKVTTTYNKGGEITICMRDESTDIVQVEEFVNLVVAQEGNSDYTFILNGLWISDITTPVYVDSTAASDRKFCYAKVHTLARFFPSVNPTDLTISEIVYVCHDERRVRQILRSDLPTSENNNKEDALYASTRRVQEDTGSGEFEVKVGLAYVDNSAVYAYTIRSTTAGLISVVVVGATLMV